MKALLVLNPLGLITLVSVILIPSAWASEDLSDQGSSQLDEPALEINPNPSMLRQVQGIAHPPIHSSTPPATTVVEWLAQIEATQVPIVGVRVEPTQIGLSVFLEIATGNLATLPTQTVGNALITDIPNAVLDLPAGESFEQFGPAEGIALVSVTNLPNGGVRVSITGSDAPPEAQVSTAEGRLVLSVVPGVAQASSGEEAIQVVVTGEQDEGYNPSDATTATRTNTPLRDIPQSIQVIPRQVIEDQAVTNISDATRNVSGVTVRGGFGGQNDNYNIRGFDNFDRLRNGFFAPSSDINPSNIERIEVLKGPASVLYGALEPGGVINFITRQPLDNPYYGAEFTVGSYSFYQPSVDLSGPLTTDGRLLYRLNAAYENSGSFVDFVDREVIQVSPTLSYEIGDNTTISLSYEYLNYEGTFYEGLPVDPVAFELPRSRFIGEPDDSLNRDSHYGNLALEHRFSENWRLRSGVAVQFNNVDIEAFRGDGVAADGQTLNRYFQDELFNRNDAYSIQTDLIGDVKTGSIGHQLLFGVEYQRYSFDNYVLYAFADPLDLFNPIYGAPVPTLFDYGPSQFTSQRDAVGLYVQDLISLLPNLKLLIGGRYDFVTEESTFRLFDLDGRTLLEEPTTDSFDNEAFSPRIGIVYQPIEPISLYASYSRSFFPNNARSSTGELFEPTRGTQYEVGVKTEWLNGTLSATLAAYQITQSNLLRGDPVNPDFSIAVGEARSRGIEFDLAGEPLAGWNIIASLFVNETKVTVGDEFSPAGDQFINAPSVGASLWSTYEIQTGDLQGLGFGIGFFYTGERQAQLPNTFMLPANVRADAAIFYNRNNWQVGLNFKNLFDATTYNYQGNGLLVGDPFTLLGLVSVTF
ncbi:MAG: TonB-dependent siderophore receptor [Nodosilinea sp.]